MINYRNYTIEEFATDEKFRQWILDPSDETVLFWDNWLLENPDKRGTVNQATELLLTVNEKYKDDLSDDTIAKEISNLVALAEATKNKNRFSVFRSPLWRAAAVFTITSGLSWFYYNSHFSVKNTAEQASAASVMITKTNTSDKQMTILLSDGSVATLSKGGSLKFPKKFAGDVRKVFLLGEAFFDVVKNPTRPFLVFANETVTKVLGTSFRVKAVDGDNTVMVVVKTGKVSVYPEKDYETLSDKDGREVVGVILRPNQQVVFNRKENRLDKGIVENPDMLSESAANQELVFDDQPVPDVLHALEKMYGIEIIFDKESLKGCAISTIFKEENLKQRISVICQAIAATYEVIDGQIIINSKGCLK
ncbi:FecR domain-containing protein [Dyadobacter sp. LHD-138]|uniref:FecR family protein n=1 Tax=Dyadobacter sp. LHD-138 TaxID=3071413 RepID=UPI0027DFA164|nr:FecR domain-containing protein [Dyadobacter sp. LHD-138]MDQ6478251.1 FecR domain-containing protein [Dyadobacter sp. LHD-138]